MAVERDYRSEQRRALGLAPVQTTAARAKESERRHSQFKHGGGPEKTASRRELSDEELFGPEISDEELFGDEGGVPELRSDPSTGRDERSAAQALNVLDWATLGEGGDEVVAAGAAADAFLRSGGDTKAAAKAYDSEVAYARGLKERWRAQPDTTPGDVISHGVGLIASAPAALPIFRGGQAAVRAISGGRATGRVGKALQTTGALGVTGAAATEASQYGAAEGSPGERLEAVQAGGIGPAVLGAGLGVAAGGLGAGGVKLAQRGVQYFRSAEDKAARYLAEKLLQAGQSVDDLSGAHAAAAKTGKPVALGDVGPQGIKDAGAAAARTPGPGREAAQATLVPRQEGQVARVSEDVAQAAGGKPGTFTKTVDEIVAARAEEAKPLYQRALGSNKPVKSAKIVEITNRPSGKAAMQRGLKIAQDEGIPLSELVITDANGNVTGYSAKALHYMKMGLDDMIESAVRSGDNAAARAYSIMKNELLGEMDRAIPGYQQARQVFAGHSANKRALEQGRQAVNKHPDEIRSDLNGLSEGEREMYRRGFAQKIIEQVEASPDAGNAARRIFGNTAKRDRLRAVLGDDEYNRLAERLGVEDAMYGSYRRTNVGSETAERQAAQGDIDDYLFGQQAPGMANGIAQTFATGSIQPLIRAVGMSGIASLLRGISQRARGHIARMLFSTDPREVKAAIAAIRKEYANAQRFSKAQDAAIAASGANPEDVLKTAGTVGGAAGIAGGTALEATAPVSPLW